MAFSLSCNKDEEENSDKVTILSCDRVSWKGKTYAIHVQTDYCANSYKMPMTATDYEIGTNPAHYEWFSVRCKDRCLTFAEKANEPPPPGMPQ